MPHVRIFVSTSPYTSWVGSAVHCYSWKAYWLLFVHPSFQNTTQGFFESICSVCCFIRVIAPLNIKRFRHWTWERNTFFPCKGGSVDSPICKHPCSSYAPVNYDIHQRLPPSGTSHSVPNKLQSILILQLGKSSKAVHNIRHICMSLICFYQGERHGMRTRYISIRGSSAWRQFLLIGRSDIEKYISIARTFWYYRYLIGGYTPSWFATVPIEKVFQNFFVFPLNGTNGGWNYVLIVYGRGSKKCYPDGGHRRRQSQMVLKSEEWTCKRKPQYYKRLRIAFTVDPIQSLDFSVSPWWIWTGKSIWK